MGRSNDDDLEVDHTKGCYFKSTWDLLWLLNKTENYEFYFDWGNRVSFLWLEQNVEWDVLKVEMQSNIFEFSSSAGVQIRF